MRDTDCLLITWAFIITLLLICGIHAIKPEWTLAYKQGVLDTKREAFKNGFMTKEVDDKDEVIYRWLEPHKYNEQSH